MWKSSKCVVAVIWSSWKLILNALHMNRMSTKEQLTTTESLESDTIHFANTDDPHDDDCVHDHDQKSMK